MIMPYWLAEALPTKCACGGLIKDNETFTKRWCSNPICPYHMAMRVEKMCKSLGFVGVGEKKALEIVQVVPKAFHWEYLPLITSEKPTILLEDLPAIAQIEGFDKQLIPYLKGKDDIEEAIQSFPPNLRPTIGPLRMCASAFNIKKLPKSSNKVLRIMITGEVHGFSSRQAFIHYLNNEFGSLVQVIDVGVRKTGVKYLIRETDAPIHNKTKIAVERNIPMITPAALIAALRNLMDERSAEDGTS